MAIIGITLILFAVALFEKGFTHDMLLETGVFLVSVKLIVQGYKASIASSEIQTQLEGIRTLMQAKGPASN